MKTDYSSAEENLANLQANPSPKQSGNGNSEINQAEMDTICGIINDSSIAHFIRYLGKELTPQELEFYTLESPREIRKGSEEPIEKILCKKKVIGKKIPNIENIKILTIQKSLFLRS